MALLPQAPTPATKAKTEAKARYLKKKKEKLKKRKLAAVASAPKGARAAAAAGAGAAAGESDESGDEDEVVGEQAGEDGQAKSKKRKAAGAGELELDEPSSSTAPAAALPPAPATADDKQDEAARKAAKKERKALRADKKRRKVDAAAEDDSPAAPVDAPAAAAAAAAAAVAPTVVVDAVASSSASSSSSRSPSPGPSSPRRPHSRSPSPTGADDADRPALEPFPHQAPLVPEPTADLLHPLTVPHALSTARLISFSHSLPLPSAPSTSSSSSSPDDNIALSARVLQRLKDLHITSLFAVQTAVIPFLLPPASTAPAGASTVAGLYPLERQRDVCVSAPTGSGKTLSYVVPIVEVLQKRVVTRLRALVILPTRDLVAQTRETFEAVAKSTGLKLASVTGSQPFAAEQALLVDGVSGQSLVDVLVCTPGRLMDHLAGTEGFSLRDLRFLVIDEADRLLNQSFNDWLQVVLARTREAASASASTAAGGVGADEGGLAWEGRRADSSVNQCQKLLFSATLTRDPAKIAALNLVDPQYFIVQDDRDAAKDGAAGGAYAEESFTVPSTLKESFVVLPTSSKPLYLLALLHAAAAPIANALVFTKSVESANRLVKLLQFVEDARAREAGPDGAKALVVRAYSSDLGGGGKAGERGRVLGAFAKGEIDILVCSDLIARGIDIPSVSHVISYDVPIDARKYVHRVGRTARAGREGAAWSLVETQEARHFKALMRSFGHLDKVAKVVLAETDLDALRPAYEAALGKLRDAVLGRGAGDD